MSSDVFSQEMEAFMHEGMDFSNLKFLRSEDFRFPGLELKIAEPVSRVTSTLKDKEGNPKKMCLYVFENAKGKKQTFEVADAKLRLANAILEANVQVGDWISIYNEVGKNEYDILWHVSKMEPNSKMSKVEEMASGSGEDLPSALA